MWTDGLARWHEEHGRNALPWRLTEWRGLGYPRRARALWLAAARAGLDAERFDEALAGLIDDGLVPAATA